MFKGFYDKMFKNSKDEILIEYKNNADDNSVLQNASALANTPANIQNAYASASAQQSYAYGYSSASSANASHAVGTNASQSRTTGYQSNPSNYAPSRGNSYTNAFSAASNFVFTCSGYLHLFLYFDENCCSAVLFLYRISIQKSVRLFSLPFW